MDGTEAQASESLQEPLTLAGLERDTLEALSDLHQRLDQLRVVCRVLSCSLHLLENRVNSLEQKVPQESTDIDLQALD